jgi:hypothetical protein
MELISIRLFLLRFSIKFLNISIPISEYRRHARNPYAIQFLFIQTIYLILRKPVVYRIDKESEKFFAKNIENRDRNKNRRNDWKRLKNYKKYQKEILSLSFSWKFGRYRDENCRETSASHNKRIKEGGEAATIKWNLYILILLAILMKAAVIEKDREINR